MATPRTLNTTLLSTNWSGAVIPAAAGQSFATVSAEWVVPKVSQPPIRGLSLTDASEWVGLDGYQSSDVCQAGILETVQTVAGKTTVSCTAWDEWYPNYATMIPSSAFAVNPGDEVRITVETLGAGSTTAGFLFDDVTTGKTYQTSLTAPPGVSLAGNAAEFVVETSELASGRSVFQPLLADFASPVVFQGAAASYASGTQAGLSGAIPIDLVSNAVPGVPPWDYVQEAYGSVSTAADTVTVTEDPYWSFSSDQLV